MENDLGGNESKIDFLRSVEEIRFCELWGEKINHRGGKDKRMLVISEGGAYLYKSKAFSRTPALSRSFDWFDMSKLAMSSPQIIEMTFTKGVITFQHQKAQDIAKKILKHIYNILMSNELPMIRINYFEAQLNQNEISNYRPILRLRAKLFSSQLPPTQELIDCYRDYYDGESLDFDLNSVGEAFGEFCPHVLFSLQLDESIQSLSIPGSEGPSHWLSVSKFFEMNQTLRSFSSGEKANNQFFMIFDVLIANPNCPVSDFSFVNSKMNAEHLASLVKLFETRRINSLSFINALTRKQLKSFFNSVETNQNFSMLKSLTISGCPGLTVLTAMHTCKSIRHLGFIGCEIELSSIIKSILKITPCQIESFNISQNEGFAPIIKNSQLPPSINEMIVDDSKMAGQNVSLLINVLSSIQNPCTISISNIQLAHSNWDYVLENFTQSSLPKVKSFYWNDNQINGFFFDFIERCTLLEYLSIDYCLFCGDNAFDDFLDFIATIDSISRLSFKGKDGSILTPPQYENLFKSFGENRYIRSVDLSGHQIGSNGLLQLAKSLSENRSIERLILKNCSKDGWFEFFSNVRGRSTPLTVEWDKNNISEHLALIISEVQRGNPSQQRTHQQSPPERVPKYRTTQKVKRIPDPVVVEDDPEEVASEEFEKEIPVFSGIVVPEIPRPDNEQIIIELKNQFSINDIINRIRAGDQK